MVKMLDQLVVVSLIHSMAASCSGVTPWRASCSSAVELASLRDIFTSPSVSVITNSLLSLTTISEMRPAFAASATSVIDQESGLSSRLNAPRMMTATARMINRYTNPCLNRVEFTPFTPIRQTALARQWTASDRGRRPGARGRAVCFLPLHVRLPGGDGIRPSVRLSPYFGLDPNIPAQQ